MSDTRRGFMGRLLALVGVVAVGAKLEAKPAPITLKPMTDAEIEAFRQKWEKQWECGAITPNEIRVLYGSDPWDGDEGPLLTGTPVPWNS